MRENQSVLGTLYGNPGMRFWLVVIVALFVGPLIINGVEKGSAAVGDFMSVTLYHFSEKKRNLFGLSRTKTILNSSLPRRRWR
jgi:hypothetical protein